MLLEKSDVVVFGNELTQYNASETTLGDTNIIGLFTEKRATIKNINVLVTTAGTIYFNLIQKIR